MCPIICVLDNRVRGRPCEAHPMVPGMDRADRGNLSADEARLAHYDPGLKRQAPAFDAMQAALMDALDRLFADAREELACLAMWSDPRADAARATSPRHV